MRGTTTFIGIIGLVLLTLITACGGSNAPSSTTGTVVTGTVQAPGGQLAMSAPTVTQWFASLLTGTESYALMNVANWTGVGGMTVRVFLIDDNGNPAGPVLATATTVADGTFTLNVPTTQPLTINLIVQITGPAVTGPVPVGTPNTFSAPVVATTVNLNPAIEAAIRDLIQRPEPLASFSNQDIMEFLDAVSMLVEQNPPPPGLLESVITNIAQTQGPAMTSGLGAIGTPRVAPLTILTTSLPNAVMQAPYASSLAAVGGTGAKTWSILFSDLPSGLPTGLTLDPTTGVLSGTPTVLGQFTFSVRVQDSANPPQQATKELPITVVPAPLVITTATLPAGTVGQAYNQTLAATGGTPPHSWSLTPGSNPLPAGLSLGADGLLSGTPTTAGTTTITAQVQDAGSPQKTTTKQLGLTINPPGPPPVSITTASPLPAGTVGQAYNTTLAATGGTLPLTWSLAPGSNPLPAGLTLNGATGQITGTPTTQGTSTPTIRVQDSANPQQSATTQLSLTINAQPPAASFSAISATLTSRRADHTATLLQDGKVLITGGFSSSTFPAPALNTAELYDPAANTFTALASTMRSARASHKATRLPNGQVLLTGGHVDTEGDGINSAELYDPATQTFTALAATMTSPRGGHVATLLPNGKVLLAGGFNNEPVALNSAELYNPTTQTFTAIVATMASRRESPTATLLPDGRVLLIGGSSSRVSSNTAEIFDPSTQSFTAITATMSSAREGHGATALASGSLLITGGRTIGNTILNTAESFDPTTQTFSPVSVGMTAPRMFHTQTTLANGSVLLTGGVNIDAGSRVILNSAEVYR